MTTQAPNADGLLLLKLAAQMEAMHDRVNRLEGEVRTLAGQIHWYQDAVDHLQAIIEYERGEMSIQ